MTPTADAWTAPWPTTSIASARSHYRRGVVALVAGTGAAQRCFGDALVADPGLYVAGVALGLCRALDGCAYTAPRAKVQLARWERQHGEIVQATFSTGPTRTRDLRREHLLEFPADLLIVWLPAARSMSIPIH